MLPEAFCKNIIDNFHQEGADWLERLPALIRQFEAHWNIRALEPFPLSFSYCAPALRPDGSEAVLKLSIVTPDFKHQALALPYYHPQGMVKLFEADVALGALLMERLKPGRMLVELKDDEAATRVAAQVMQSLWAAPPAGLPLNSVAHWMDDFRNIQRYFEGRACPLPAGAIERTEKLFAALYSPEHPQTLLHGDLHHFNILSVEEPGGLGWRAIDPFGVVGEKEIEVASFLRNPHLRLPVTPELVRMTRRRMDIFQEMLGFDRQKMAAWASIYTVISAWWTLSTGQTEGWQIDAALADLFLELA